MFQPVLWRIMSLGTVPAGYVGGAVITWLYASAVHLWPTVDVLVAYVFGSLQCICIRVHGFHDILFAGTVFSRGTSIQNAAL